MALFSRSVELPEHMPRISGTASGGTCYKRRNDDCGSSFRNRDKEPIGTLFEGYNACDQVID